MNDVGTVLAAASNQLPEDVGKSGPLGLLLIVLLLLATALLVRSMSKHLKRIPRVSTRRNRIEIPAHGRRTARRPGAGRGDPVDRVVAGDVLHPARRQRS